MESTRVNGRRPAELRPVRIQRRYTRHAEGSVLVEFGDTRVFSRAELDQLLDLAAHGIAELVQHQKQSLGL